MSFPANKTGIPLRSRALQLAKIASQSRVERQSLQTVVTTIACWFLLSCVSGVAGNAATATKEQIFAKWREREEAVDAVTLIWETSMTWLNGSPSDDPFDNSPPQGAKPHTAAAKTHLTFDRRRVRQYWINSDTGHLALDFSCDGSRCYSFDPAEKSREDDFPVGRIFDAESGGPPGSPQFLPPYWHYRILSSWSRMVDRDSLAVSDRQTIIDGHDCVVLVERPTDSRRFQLEKQYFVAQDLQYAIVRCVVRQSNRMRQQIDVAYTNDVDGARLSQWTVQQMDERGEPEIITKCVVEGFQIDPKLSNDHFVLTFPAGTVVTDDSAGTKYLVREDDHRIITDEERFATYDQVVNSESGEAFSTRSRLLRLLLLGSIGLALAVLIGWRVSTRIRSGSSGGGQK